MNAGHPERHAQCEAVARALAEAHRRRAPPRVQHEPRAQRAKRVPQARATRRHATPEHERAPDEPRAGQPGPHVGDVFLEVVDREAEPARRAGRSTADAVEPATARAERVVEVLAADVQGERPAHDRRLTLQLLRGDMNARVAETEQRALQPLVANERRDVAVLDACVAEQRQVRARRTRVDAYGEHRQEALLARCEVVPQPGGKSLVGEVGAEVAADPGRERRDALDVSEHRARWIRKRAGPRARAPARRTRR